MSKWSTAQQNAAGGTHHHYEPVALPSHPPPPPAPQSEFVRFVRNVQPTERHVVFADDYIASPQPASQSADGRSQIMRPPLDFLTYAGKRWILDPTQFMEPDPNAVQPPAALSLRSSVQLGSGSAYAHAYAASAQQPDVSSHMPSDVAYAFSGRRDDQRHELLSSLQTVEPLLRQRSYLARMEAEPQTPLRAAVYPKAEAYPLDECEIVDSGEPDSMPKSALFESILAKVQKDSVIIEDIVEPPAQPVEATTAVNNIVAVAAETFTPKPPTVLATIEDAVYGEKIVEPTPLETPAGPIIIEANPPAELQQPTVGATEVPPQTAQPASNTAVAADYTVEQEAYDYQPNEPVYSDAEYAQQYEYQEYDASAYADTTAAVDPSAAAAAVFGEQQPYPDADTYAPTAVDLQPPIYQQQQQQQVDQYRSGEQYADDPNAAVAAGQPVIDGDLQYNQDYGQLPDQQQPLAYDDQYGSTDPSAQAAVDAQMYAQPPAESYDQQQYDQQQYEQQQYYDQQQQEAEATAQIPYDPNAEYQVADDGGGGEQPISQPDAYYAEQETVAPAAPVADPYYGDPYGTDDQQQNIVGESAPLQDDVVAAAAATTAGVAPNYDEAPNYVTSETDNSGGVSAPQPDDQRQAPDDSTAGNTESDFDFSVQ